MINNQGQRKTRGESKSKGIFIEKKKEGLLMTELGEMTEEMRGGMKGRMREGNRRRMREGKRRRKIERKKGEMMIECKGKMTEEMKEET